MSDDQELTLPGGEKLVYRDRDHSYWLDGKRLPSVTTLLKVLDKPNLSRRGGWIERQSVIGAHVASQRGELDGVAEFNLWERVRSLGLGCAKQDEGANRGTIVHTVYEALNSGAPLPDPASLDAVARGFLPAVVHSWEALGVEKLVASEQIVAHTELRYAGRLDTLVETDGGRLTLLDYKSGKGRVWLEAHYQTRSYQMAAKVSLGLDVERIVIVGIGEKGPDDFELVECEATEEDVRALVHIYRAGQRIDRGMNAQRRAWQQQRATPEEAAA